MIALRGVSKSYVAGQARSRRLQRRDRAGEFVFIVGHSGSGKSTFIRLLLRELLPTTRADHRRGPGPRAR